MARKNGRVRRIASGFYLAAGTIGAFCLAASVSHAQTAVTLTIDSSKVTSIQDQFGYTDSAISTSLSLVSGIPQIIPWGTVVAAMSPSSTPPSSRTFVVLRGMLLGLSGESQSVPEGQGADAVYAGPNDGSGGYSLVLHDWYAQTYTFSTGTVTFTPILASSPNSWTTPVNVQIVYTAAPEPLSGAAMLLFAPFAVMRRRRRF